MKIIKDTLQNIAAEIKTGKTPPTGISEYFGDEINWYTPSDLDKERNLAKSQRGITQKAIDNKKAVIFKPNTVLIGCIGDIGKIGITSAISSSNQQITGIYPNQNKIKSQYLYYWLKANKKILKEKSANAILPILNNKQLGAIYIDFPESIPDQLHIANLLSCAESLISQRKESIRLLDEYLKSTFLEMFGDPVRNEKGWKIHKFGDFILDIIAGSSYGGEQQEKLLDDELGVLKVSAVTWGVFNPKEFKAIKKVEIKGRIINPLRGDLLFSRANTRELVGATCIVDNDYPNLFLPDKLWKIKLKDEELNKVFIHYLFQQISFKFILTNGATGTSGSMLNISMEKLRNVKIPVPKFKLQTQFSQIVENTEALKAQYQQSLQELENLYGSLSQRAFRGEL